MLSDQRKYDLYGIFLFFIRHLQWNLPEPVKR